MLPTRLVVLARLLVTVAVLGGLAACAAPPAQPAQPAPPAPAAAPAAGHGAHGAGGVGLYAVQSGPLGVVTTDAEGHLLYRSDADSPSGSTCTGECARTWLPLLLPPGTEPELLGIDPELVGLLDRPEGRQLTLGGWPLYHRADDAGGLTDAGAHGADGTWFAITPTGDKAA